MSRDIPTFAVIGRVNKGKSSIVSTLAEDDSVAIDAEAGTTRECREYPVRADGVDLLVLIDTPGFQQAPRALAWMREQEVSAANRREAVARLVDTFAGTGEFTDECRLLRPILAGAGILYVVDGAKPFRRNYEAEMEILRWTGQPRMALVNQIGAGDFSHQWRPALDQYFSIVRTFDAHHVSFEDRIKLYRAFRELHEPWRPRLEEAIVTFTAEWQRRQRYAAHVIAKMLVDQLSYVREITLTRYERPEDHKLQLEQSFHDALRKREQRARREIERLYQHLKIETEEQALEKPVFEQDLFAESTWRLLGLPAKQLIGLGAVTGAMAGGMLDAAVGGASFLAGTLLGGAIGAGSAFYYSAQRLATIDNLRKYMQGNRILRIGPHQNKNFPWILLDRALLHYASIRDLAHSRRDPVKLDYDVRQIGLVAQLSAGERREFAKIFAAIRARAGRSETSRYVDALVHLLAPVLQRV